MIFCGWLPVNIYMVLFYWHISLLVLYVYVYIAGLACVLFRQPKIMCFCVQFYSSVNIAELSGFSEAVNESLKYQDSNIYDWFNSAGYREDVSTWHIFI